MNIAVSGLRDCGSSAVIDLLESFEGCGVAVKEDYEHYAYTFPGAFIDLEDKLLLANDPHRSDEAIRAFLKAMDRLYRYNFGWFGSYRSLLGEPFMDAVNEFVDAIATKSDAGAWYGRYLGTRPSLAALAMQLGGYLFKGARGLRWGVRDVVDASAPFYSSHVDKAAFCAAARRFSERYFELCRPGGCEHAIYDHLLWPQNADRADDLFGGDFKMITVRRDPRDIFANQKYVWSAVVPNYVHVLPEEPEAFCDYLSGVARGAYDRNDDRVTTVWFEDLVYRFDDTLERLCAFLGLDPARRDPARSRFDPSVSINNTQIFTGAPEWEAEAEIIARRLPGLTYDYPYRREYNGEAAKAFVRGRVVAKTD